MANNIKTSRFPKLAMKLAKKNLTIENLELLEAKKEQEEKMLLLKTQQKTPLL